MARVLIVEDEASLARAIGQGLQDEHHAVEVALDGRSGLAAALRETHDLVILDLMLPGIDGVEFCRRLRAARVVVPVLMLTARDTTADIVRGLDAGANDYLTKPFAFEELLARVRALLRGSSGGGSRLRVGPLVLDTSRRRAFCGGDELELTAKEFQLLETFMLRPGRILSRARLTEILWEQAREPSSNAVEVHVSSLRRKLQPRNAGEMIRTLRGRGYVLEEPRR